MKDKLDVDEDQMWTSEGSPSRAWCSKRVSCCPLGLADSGAGGGWGGSQWKRKGPGVPQREVCTKGRVLSWGSCRWVLRCGASYVGGWRLWLVLSWTWGKDQGSCQYTGKSWLFQSVRYRVTLHLPGFSYPKIMVQRLPWWSNGWDSMIRMLGTWVWFLVRELRSHMPRDVAKK